jgi:hypothetical protein
VQIIKPLSISLLPVPLGSGYSGPETYRESATISTGDGALTIGVWGYHGELRSTNPGDMHHAWVVTRGSIQVHQAGHTVVAGPSDLVLFEAPYAEKNILASHDFLATWITVPRRPS